MTKFLKPEKTRQEIADVLVKALERGLTDDERSTIFLKASAISSLESSNWAKTFL